MYASLIAFMRIVLLNIIEQSVWNLLLFISDLIECVLLTIEQLNVYCQ